MPAVRRAALALVVVALAPWTATDMAARAAPVSGEPGHPRLRLVAGADSVVGSLTLPLGSALQASAPTGERRTAPLRSTGFSLVALTWTGSDPRLRVRARSGGAWGPWAPAPVLTDLPGPGEGTGTRGTDPIWVGSAHGVQVGVRGASPGDLALVLIDPGELASDTAGSRSQSPSQPATRSRPSARRAPSSAPRPELRSRQDWGANERWRSTRPRYNKHLKQVHVHHTVNANDYPRREVPGLIRGMYRYHTESLGWSDLGYNFLVDRFGRTWVGRAGGEGRRVRGAHTLGFNNTSTGVAVIGNSEKARPRRAVLTALVRLAAWKLDRNDRSPAGTTTVRSQGSDRYHEGEKVRLPVIDGHRDTNRTACPGEELYDLLPVIRRRAQHRVDRY